MEENARCSVVARDRDGNRVEVTPTWASTEPSIVDVDDAGVLTPKKLWGSARVVAAADTVSAWHDVRVVKRTEPREAEEIAVYLSGELRPPAPLADSVFEELERIRETFGDTVPIVDGARFRLPWFVNQIVIRFTEEGARQFEAGDYDAWDSLNAALGVERIEPSGFFDSSPSVVVHFGPVLNIRRVLELYEGLPELKWMEDNGFAIDGTGVYPRTLEGRRTYLFRDVWGNCFTRCGVVGNWYFEVRAGEVSFLGADDPENDSEPPPWWEEARENFEVWQGS